MQTQDLVLDIVPGGVPPVIDVTQYDTARAIKITLSSRTSASFSLSSSYTYELRGTRANKTGFIDTEAVSMIDSRTLIFTTTGTMTSVAGDCKCGILIFDGDEHIETINFIMQVHKSSLDLDTIVNSDDFRDLLDIAIGEYIAQHGTGVPPGGTTDQVLKKRSNNDLDTEWADESGGGGGAVNSVNGQTGDVVLAAVDVSALPNDTTAADLGAYVKPSGGIPASDLASAVQTSLGKADSAYQKPSGGIPAADLASGVIPSVPSAYTSTPSPLGTAAAGSSSGYAKGDHVHAMPSASDVGAAPVVTEVTISTSGAISQALDAGKIYHFTGAISALTLTLNAAGTGVLPLYHFDFESGSTAATVSITGVTWPGGSFAPEASKHYEVDILNGVGVYLSW